MVAPIITLNNEDYVLTFNDEFNGTDASYWQGYGDGDIWATSYSPHLDDSRYIDTNGELQYYVDPDDQDLTSPFTVGGGVMTINARELTTQEQAYSDGQQYSSGLLTTEMSFAMEGGYIEMRADLPDQQGFWSAFWMLPDDGDWSAEIDVFEVLGDTGGTVHTNVWDNGTPDEQAITGFDVGNGFHTYGLLWDDQTIQWLIDGQVVRTTTNTVTEEMFLAIGLAVGGWAGDPDATTDFSDGMAIDYVRVYELDSNPDRNEAIQDGQFVGRDKGKGTDFDDVVYGSRWMDVLDAGDGNDLVYGRKGTDDLSGGTGDDEVYGQKGDDQVFGGDGNDKLIGGQGEDVLHGGAGTDHHWGGAYAADGSSDRFVFDDLTDKDFVHDFEAGIDDIDLSALSVDWATVDAMLYDYGWATKINLGQVTGDYGDMVYLVGTAKSSLSEDDFVLSVA